MDIPVLYSSDDKQIERKSSLLQHRDKLSIKRQGGYLPISYDVLETIGCDGVTSHRAILSLNPDDIGYIFPIATCERARASVLLSDKQGIELEELPFWYGSGLYEKFVDEHIIVKGDNHPLGEFNTVKYKVGLSYYLAKKTLPAVA